MIKNRYDNFVVTSEEYAIEKNYWLQQLSGFAMNHLIYDHTIPRSEGKYDETQYQFSAEIFKGVQSLSKGSDLATYLILLAGLKYILSMYTGSEDILVVSPIFKQKVKAEFINYLLPLRTQITANMSFKDLLLEVKKTVSEATKHQNYPIYKIIELLNLPTAEDVFPLTDVMVMLENIHDQESVSDERFHIAFRFLMTAETLGLTLRYNSERFTADTMHQMIHYLTRFLEICLQNPEIRLAELEMISPEEKQNVLFDFNHTEVDYPRDQTILHLLAEQVGRMPEQIAVVFEDQQMTYQELHERSNRLAHILRDKGVKPEEIVAIMVDPGLEMFIGCTAIMKAGGAFLPIDPAHPRERIEYMLSDTQSRIILTQSHLADRLSGVEVLVLDKDEALASGAPVIEIINQPHDLAYVIYTSGSTGKPKGVLIEHRSLVNLVCWHKEYFQVTPADHSTKFAGFSFDGSVWEIFPYLSAGATIYVVPDRIRLDVNKINEYFEANRITIAFLPTQLCEQFMLLENHSLRILQTAGEKLKSYRPGEYHLINNYGPTENTVHVTSFLVERAYANIPIGKPMNNTQVYILDRHNHLQPIGIAGELCISGDGLARGYLNQPELTESKFVINPHTGKRMYRTGDRAKWLPDGNLAFLGRMDYQVKIRGFRIELEEIENLLLSHDLISEAVVIDRENEHGEKYLCAYIVANEELAAAELREYLKHSLPDYMIPSYFVKLDQIPITVNGKIDKRALPEPKLTQEVEYVPPTNEIEEKLVKIWSEVLGIERIGINDDFFALGGHSLKAMMVNNQTSKEFDVELPVRQIFDDSTVKKLAKFIEEAEKTVFRAIKSVDKREYYPVSSAQKRQYVINQLDRNNTNYNIPFVTTFTGEINVQQLEETFKKLIHRHESLRTSFVAIDEQVMQKIDDDVEFAIQVHQVSKDELHEVVNGLIQPFDLSKAPLLRASLVQYEGGNIFVMDMHHIIADGVSMNILVKDFFQLLAGNELPELSIQYKDFAVWQNEFTHSDLFKRQEKYWLETFADEIPVLNMPTDYLRPFIFDFAGDQLDVVIGEEVSAQLKMLASQNGATLFMVLLAAFNVLLAKYTNQEDIVVGTPIAGRHHADLENIIGMFVNTLALRNHPSMDKTFVQFLGEVKEKAFTAYDNQDYQFELLIDQLKLERDLSRNPLFDVMFVFQNASDTKADQDALEQEPVTLETKLSKFDLTVSVFELKQGLSCSFEYATKLFKRESIARLAGHFGNILQEITDNPALRLSEIKMISEEEEQFLVAEVNQTRGAATWNQTLSQIFEEQAANNPEQAALTLHGEQMTYRELNERSNQLARVLRDKGVKAEQVVAIMAERSFEMVIGIFGILKAGGAYLPLNPADPEERIRFMLEDSQSQLCLVHKKRLSDFAGELIDLEDAALYTGDASNLKCVNTPSDLAYIIYTSGTTGIPKGNLTMHYNVPRVVKNTNYIDLHKQDRILQLSNYAFDGSIFDIFGALLNGATLVLVDQDVVLDLGRLAALIQRENVSVFFVTTALFNMLVETHLDCLRNVRKILFGGERVSVDHARKALDHLGKDRIIHVYGPTESTVYATYYHINDIDCNATNIPIGSPLTDTAVYVLSKYNQLQPVGVPGELCISGDGLSRGYLHREELTKEKFVDHPFIPNAKMYKTGDLVKRLPDGNIEFLGRIDNQVKIRGFRIELGEIESKLLSHDSIQEAVVLDRNRENGEKYLCAYIVSTEDISITKIREYLSKKLPEFMIPSYFIKMDQIPLNLNGKVNRKLLPEPDGSVTTGTEYIAPTNETEARLVQMWSEILGVERIGINDSFFVLGGHSLKAMTIVARISKEFHVEIPLLKLFDMPTIKELAAYIGQADQTVYASIKPVEPREYYPVSSAQKRQYVLHQLDRDSITYNMPFIQVIPGHLDLEHLQGILHKLIQRHESLRTSFAMMDGNVVQYVHPDVEFTIDDLEASKENLSDLIQAMIRPFDLSKAPLFRVGVIRYEDGNVLVMDMHHIISDGVSLTIMEKELNQLSQHAELPELKIQYKDFAVWQNEFLVSEELREKEAYWLQVFSGEIPVLNMPTDYPRPAILSFEGDEFNFSIGKEITEKLRELSLKNNATLFMVLLAAYNVLLAKYTGQEDIIVGSPIAGRPYADLENIVGMFVNTLAFRNNPASDKTVSQFVAEVKHHALRGFEHQEYQFEMLLDQLNLTRDMSRNPLFDVAFTLRKGMGLVPRPDQATGTPLEWNFKVSKFDFTLFAVEAEDAIEFSLEYSTRLFKPETMEKLAQHFINILWGFVQNPDRRLAEIEMISEEEKEILLLECNDTFAAYPKNQTITSLFEEQVKKAPDKIAVVCADQQLSYHELDVRANQLARILREQGVQPNKIIGVMPERSLGMIIAYLGVLKAGGAYLPIDHTYPEERIQFMLEDSNVDILLTHDHLLEKVSFAKTVIRVDDLQIVQGATANLQNVNHPHDLAYVIYTSGSTGKPKGVLLEHHGIANLHQFFEDELGVTADDNIVQFASCAFDASVWETYMALLSGATLYIPSKETINDFAEFETYLDNNKITIITVPPIYLNHLDPGRIHSLRTVITAGSATNLELVNRWKDQVEYINAYGPTETTICATIWKSSTNKMDQSSIPIGKPIHNTQIYILDRNNRPVPFGVEGEICISGVGLARGYLNRPELTSEKFVSHPFFAGEIMYKTGDLGRWLPDRNIEFLGRIDHQVKIRGFRIELGEIESQLVKFHAIKEAIVIARQDVNGEGLCAYYVSEEEQSVETLRNYLANKLPDYMIPAHFVHLTEFPVTSNGKIDRKALPEPETNRNNAYVAPRTTIEKILVEVWGEVLRLDQVGILDNFFEAGGDSIKAMQVVSRLANYEYHCQVQDLLLNPTIEKLATKVEKTKDHLKDEQRVVSGKIPLAPIQRRILSDNQIPNKNHYAFPAMFKLKKEIDHNLMKKAFEILVEHHDALRINYDSKKEISIVNNRYLKEEFDLKVFDFSKLSPKQQGKQIYLCGTELMKSYNIEKELLLKACIFDLGENGKRLLIAPHHMVTDSVSQRILIEDLVTIYTQLADQATVQLPLKTTSYQRWVYEIEKYSQSPELLAEQSYWDKLLSTNYHLPVDFDKGPDYGSCMAKVAAAMTEEETDRC